MKFDFIILIIALLFLSGCTIYMPQPATIALMTAKNEVQLSGGITIIPGVTASAAYSPISHLAMQFHGFLAPDQINYYQAAIGYYAKTSSSFIYEIYGGYGKGQGTRIKNSVPATLEGNYNLYYTQFNFGQANQGKKHVDYGAGLKAGLFNVHLTDYGYYESNGLDPVLSDNRYILLEPAAFIRFGNERIKAGFQVNGVSFINRIKKQKQIPYHTVTFGISLNYKFRIGKK